MTSQERDGRIREYGFPLALAVIIALLGTVPYVYAYRHTPAGERFMGFVGRGTNGSNGYLMMAKQVQQGASLIENKLTPEPLPRTYFNLEWWAFGSFARWTGLSLIATFHVDRVLTVFLVLLSLYFLASVCLEGAGARRMAVSLAVLGSGFGWIIWSADKAFGLQWPFSLDLQGVSTAAYLMNKPHFARAVALAALQYAFLILGETRGRRRYFVYSGLAAVLRTAVRPYHIPETCLVYVLVPVLLAWRDGRLDLRRMANYGIALLIHLSAALYFVWLAQGNVLGMAGWKRNGILLVPMLLWLGLPFLLTCAGFVASGLSKLRSAGAIPIVLGAWLFMAWLLENAFPYYTAAHESSFEAYSTAPILLALLGPIPWLYARLKSRWPVPRAMAGLALLLCCMPSSVYVYGRFFVDCAHPGNPPWRYYVSEDFYQALCWLEANTGPEKVVLASDSSSQFIPVVASNKTVTGHDMLTAWYNEKNAEVGRFYGAPGDEDFKRSLIRKYRVAYVLFGPYERVQNGMRPQDYPWLRPVFSRGPVSVFAVELPE